MISGDALSGGSAGECEHGTLYRRLGRRDAAYAELSTAMALYGAMEMAFWLSRAEAELAQVA